MRVSRLLLQRSVLWFVLGIAVWLQPAIPLTSLVLLLGMVLLLDGVMQVVHALGGIGPHSRWAGFVGIAQGVLSFLVRSITPVEVLIYVAFWGIATGFIEVFGALRARKEGADSFWMGLAGIAAVGFGLLLLSRERREAASISSLVAIGAVAFAVALAVLGAGAYLVAARRSNSAVGTRA